MNTFAYILGSLYVVAWIYTLVRVLLYNTFLPAVGTRSLLFGVHQFLWHPITVFFAWRGLYHKWPTWRETVCIVIHDWGYWGCPNMDGPEGEKHPWFGAKLASWLFDKYPTTVEVDSAGPWYNFVLHHSRHLARNIHREPSKLCWADKYCMCYDPWWIYLPRAILSGEIREYRANAVNTGKVPAGATNRQWHRFIVAYMTEMTLREVREMDPLVVSLRKQLQLQEDATEKFADAYNTAMQLVKTKEFHIGVLHEQIKQADAKFSNAIRELHSRIQ